MTYGTTNWPGFVKCYPNALGHSLTSFVVASPQEPGKSVHFAHSPIWFLLHVFLGIFLVLFYFFIITAQFINARHIFSYFFLNFVYSGITPNTTNSFFPCFSQKKQNLPKYAPKWPAQHLNHQQITLRFYFKQHSLWGPVSCKQIKVEQLWWRQDRSCCSVSPRILGASLIHFSFLLAPILREPKISRKRNPTCRPLHLRLVKDLKSRSK